MTAAGPHVPVSPSSGEPMARAQSVAESAPQDQRLSRRLRLVPRTPCHLRLPSPWVHLHVAATSADQEASRSLQDNRQGRSPQHISGWAHRPSRNSAGAQSQAAGQSPQMASA